MGNFEFLSSYPAIFLQLARGAERTVHADPNASLIKMRQVSEAMARHACASLNIFTGQGARQLDHIDALEQRGILKGDVDKLFHALRVAGNRAAHDFVGTRATALQHLGLTFRLACWFHKSFGGDAAKGFKSPTFVEPRDAQAEHADKDAELRRVQAELEATRQRADTEAARREAAEQAASLTNS
jgi:type I restriction enzyme R subunit